MNRKKFLVNTSKAVVATIGGASLGFIKSNKITDVKVSTPLPIQVVIDDVGWWNGKDGSVNNEPYRTGIKRNHVVADYQAIVDLGKALNIRPQAVMILSEWDRENILKKVAHSTYMGKKWNNSKWVGPWLDEAAEIINQNEKYIEITLHGLGHEWWDSGKFTRAEWAELETGIMRNEDDVKRHLDAFYEIMKQNNLGAMPTTFVPTAFAHGFGVTKGNKKSMAQILKSRGFTYINTIFSIQRKDIMGNLDKVQYGDFGVDSGVLTVNRGHDVTSVWSEINTDKNNILKKKPNAKVDIATCGMHWPNMLHEKPEKNFEVVEDWVNFLAPYNEKLDTMLAKNSVEFQKQLVHNKFTRVGIENNSIKLDFSQTRKVGTVLNNDEVTIKINSKRELKFFSATVPSLTVSSKKKEELVMYTIKLKLDNSEKVVVNFS